MDRVRIQEIADEAGTSNAILIEKAKELGYNVKAANSTVTIEEAGILVDYTINGVKPKVKKPKAIVKIQDVNKIKLSIFNLKSIKEIEWEFDLKKGVMAVIGENGIGKSSFIIALAKLIHPYVFRNELVGNGYKNTKIEYKFEEEKFIWKKPDNWKEENNKRMPKIHGYFESSILDGKRFRIYNNLKEIEVNEHEDNITIASEFIRENMNYVMYGKDTKEERFKTLHRVEGKRKKKRIGSNQFEFKNYKWYALKIDNQVNSVHYIHEYFLSTGEYFLLSLLKFIEELVIKTKNNELAMIIIDEIELSLHTLAQRRLVEKLTEFSEKYNILIIFTTHSLQIIERMNPENIYLFKNIEGNCSISSPSYPGYLTSRLETHKYYDRIILVEDDLAKFFITLIIRREENFINNVSYKIIPIGGWEKVLEIYLLNDNQRFFGDAVVMVVLDGDQSKTKKVNQGVNKNIKKNFLPLENIEKYVVELLVNKDEEFIQYIERDIQPYTFENLDIFIDSKPFENTKKIKNLYSKFIKSSIKLMTHVSEIEFEKSIISFILKRNEEADSYKKFTENIISFINNKP